MNLWINGIAVTLLLAATVLSVPLTVSVDIESGLE